MPRGGDSSGAIDLAARTAGDRAEDLDTARLVTRFQAGDREAYSTIYTRYFDRVYGYMLVVLNNQHDAEDAAQQVFVNVLEALPRYERRRQPFRAWLFAAVRNQALTELERRGRLEPIDPSEIDALPERAAEEEPDLSALGWISDIDLLTFVEHMPLLQRQVLVMRFMLGLSSREVGTVLGRRPDHIRNIQYRAVNFLRDRLISIGRAPPERRETSPPMRRAKEQAPVLRSRRFAL